MPRVLVTKIVRVGNARPGIWGWQSAEERKLQGNTALRAGDLEGALRAYGEAIELDPSNPIYFSNRAAVYTRS